MTTLAALPPARTTHPLLAGLRAPWQAVLLIALINLGFAAVLWVDDPRPFWHPLLTCQLYGFCIAYCINVASPGEKPHAIARLAVAVVAGASLGVVLVILVKQYDIAYVIEHAGNFGWNLFSAILNGFVFGLIFHLKSREARTSAALLRANADRHLLSRQAAEAELKLLQAQVEPHFLFNTLASVQYLTETDPARANELLGHLIAYLRAAVPQLRAASSTLGQEVDLAEAYLSILRMRMGERLRFDIAVPPALRSHPFPANMLVSLVENSIKHGIEPTVHGGSITIGAEHRGDALVVSIADTGTGVVSGEHPAAGHGVGLANLRERLLALYGEQGRFALTPQPAGGAMATLSVPFDDAAAAVIMVR